VRTIFTLASGRSSTRFLYEIITRNALDCVATHEPYVSNPSMFGPAVYAHASGDQAYLRALLERKRRAITRHAPKTYVETSHSFLKSWYDLAPEYFPNTGAIHLVRHPFKVAKSFVNREARLSRFQWYLLEWIEVENRAARFLDLMGTGSVCVHLRVPEDINDPEQLRMMLDRLELRSRSYEIDLSGFKNATPGQPTVITDEDYREAAELLAQLPRDYLDVFRTAPYAHCPWASELLPDHVTTQLRPASNEPPRSKAANS
jgi:hypothetical protein